MSEENWIEVGSTDSIEEEDLIRFDHQDKTFCVYKLTDGFYATDGICTHEAVHLEDGLVMDDEIECPMHQGIFNIKSGEASPDLILKIPWCIGHSISSSITKPSSRCTASCVQIPSVA